VREDGYDVFLRNEALAQDSTTTEEILSDYVQKNSSDYICVINPTNPFLTAATIDNFLLEFSAEGYDTAFSVTAHQKHFFMNNKPINFDWSGPHPRTQDVTPVYSLNWAIVMWRTRLVKEKITKRGDSLYLGKVGFIAVDHWECFDIDTAEDYAMALKILATVNHENY
jgi:CMP-N-acetylneuraminic acid synthetase